MMLKFDPGAIVATPGALAVLTDSGQSPAEFLGRHLRGDWATWTTRTAC
jgi:hypothetical protein